jgi:hypothetical protein
MNKMNVKQCVKKYSLADLYQLKRAANITDKDIEKAKLRLKNSKNPTESPSLNEIICDVLLNKLKIMSIKKKKTGVKFATQLSKILIEVKSLIKPMLTFIKQNPQLKNNILTATRMQKSFQKNLPLEKEFKTAIEATHLMVKSNLLVEKKFGKICSLLKPQITLEVINSMQAMVLIIEDIIVSKGDALLYIDIGLVEQVITSGQNAALNMVNVLQEVSRISTLGNNDEEVKQKIYEMCSNAASGLAEFNQNLKYAEEALNSAKYRKIGKEESMASLMNSWIKHMLKTSTKALSTIALTLTLTGMIFIMFETLNINNPYRVQSQLASTLNTIRLSYQTKNLDPPIFLDYIQTPIHVELSLKDVQVWDRFKRMLVSPKIPDQKTALEYIQNMTQLYNEYKSSKNESVLSEFNALKNIMPTYFFGGQVYASLDQFVLAIVNVLQTLYEFINKAMNNWVQELVSQLNLSKSLINIATGGAIGSLTYRAFELFVKYSGLEFISNFLGPKITFIFIMSMWISRMILTFPYKLYLWVFRLKERSEVSRALMSENNPIMGYTCLHGTSFDEEHPPNHMCRPRFVGESKVKGEITVSKKQCEIECNNQKLIYWLLAVNETFYSQPQKYVEIMERTLKYVSDAVSPVNCSDFSFNDGSQIWVELCKIYVKAINEKKENVFIQLERTIKSLDNFILKKQACWINTNKLLKLYVTFKNKI